MLELMNPLVYVCFAVCQKIVCNGEGLKLPVAVTASEQFSFVLSLYAISLILLANPCHLHVSGTVRY